MEDTITADSGVVEETSGGLDIASASDSIASDLGLGKKEPAESSLNEGDDEDYTPDAEIPAEESAPVIAKHPAPASWKKEMHAHWESLTPEMQEYVELREKQMAEGLEKDRVDSNLGRTMRDIMSPYREMLRAQGVDEPGAVKTLLNAHYKLSNSEPAQKADYFRQLAQAYGVDIGTIGNTAAEENIDPTVRALRDELNGIKYTLTASHQAAIQEAKARTITEVDAFASDPAHPYFDEVADDIVHMIQAGHNLKDAYEKAVWANPVTRQKELARLSQENEASLRAKAKEAAERARKAAGTNVRGRDLTKTPTEPKGTMEDTMRETLRNIKTRTN